MDIRFYIGAFFVIIGIISLFGYITKNEKMFSHKEWYNKTFGAKLGVILHFGRYVITPLVLGIGILLFR